MAHANGKVSLQSRSQFHAKAPSTKITLKLQREVIPFASMQHVELKNLNACASTVGALKCKLYREVSATATVATCLGSSNDVQSRKLKYSVWKRFPDHAQQKAARAVGKATVVVLYKTPHKTAASNAQRRQPNPENRDS